MTLFLVIISVLALIANAAFSGDPQACWKRNCVVRNDAGTICLEADSNGSAALDCASPILQNLTKVHHNSSIGRSIVYYDQTGSILGAATWPVPNPLTFPVYVCMTGTRLDDPSIQRTICRSVTRDDDMEDYAAHIHECVVEQPSTPQRDPCYRPVNEGSPAVKRSFYEQPVAAGLFWILSCLVTLGTVYGVLAKWGTAIVARVRECWVAADHRLPTAHNRDNHGFELNGIGIPMAQPFEPTKAVPHNREAYGLRF